MSLPTERGRELDAAVAVEVMGWSDYRQGEAFDYLGVRACRLWCPTWRHEDNLVVEGEIERRGLRDEYLNALSAILGAGDLIVAEDYYEAFWRIIRATPESRCLAALAAVREAKGAKR